MKRGTLVVAGVALVIVAAGVYFFLGGNFVPSTATPENQQSAVIVPFTPLAQGLKSTVTTRVNYLITSTDQLNKLWKMVDAEGQPPKVDFTKEAVIAVFSGKQPTGGYAIQVSKIVDSTSRLVSVTIQKPDSTCMVTQSFTTPYEIVTIPATTIPLTHEDHLATTSCK